MRLLRLWQPIGRQDLIGKAVDDQARAAGCPSMARLEGLKTEVCIETWHGGMVLFIAIFPSSEAEGAIDLV